MTDSAKRLDGDPNRRQQEHGRDGGGRDGLGFAMAIRMIFIGWFRRDHQTAPHNDRTENVRHRFHRIGYQRMRMTQDAGDQLDGRKRGIGGQAQEGGAQTAFESVVQHIKTYCPFREK